MTSASPQEVTQLLVAWSAGDEAAFARLVPLVEAELNRLAHAYMRKESANHTFQTSDLVNDAYVRLIKWKDIPWQNRAHFIGTTARLMRRILVDHARKKRTQLHGAPGLSPVSSEAAARVPQAIDFDVLALDDGLTDLAKVDKRQAEIVELKIYGGFTNKEIAHALDLAEKTIQRKWKAARLWLYRYLNNKQNDENDVKEDE